MTEILKLNEVKIRNCPGNPEPAIEIEDKYNGWTADLTYSECARLVDALVDWGAVRIDTEPNEYQSKEDLRRRIEELERVIQLSSLALSLADER